MHKELVMLVQVSVDNSCRVSTATFRTFCAAIEASRHELPNLFDLHCNVIPVITSYSYNYISTY